jgi:hypothetical protein
MRSYILDKNKMVKQVDDIFECAELFGSDERIVQQTRFYKRRFLFWRKEIFISTIFLVFDHNFDPDNHVPVLFETMVFVNGYEQDMWRYCTWEQAEAGHRLMCEQYGYESCSV